MLSQGGQSLPLAARELDPRQGAVQLDLQRSIQPFDPISDGLVHKPMLSVEAAPGKVWTVGLEGQQMTWKWSRWACVSRTARKPVDAWLKDSRN